MPTRFDAVVIGTGQSGPTLANRLAGEGHKTAIIERARFGGTCVNYGCIPTKALVASARVAYLARRAADFGVQAGPISVDMQQVKVRKERIVAQSRDGLEDWLKGTDNLTVYEGHARFTAPNRVRVDSSGDELEADRIVINVGARANIPPIEGLADVPHMTNSHMLELDALPEHLLIIGGSYIGLEFAQIYRRFGSQVTVIERGDRLIKREDPDVSDAIREILEAEGIEIRLSADCVAAESREGRVAVRLNCAAGAPQIIGSHLLVAAGRRPNTDDLGLEHTRVETDDRGYIRVNGRLETTAPGIFATGEVNGRGAFTHTSYNDYEVLADHLFGPGTRSVSDRITAYALYIDPPLGRVGMTEAQVRASGRKALKATLPMTRVGRANERSETRGFMKILVDAETERVLGAALLGINGDEVVHSLLDVMYADAPYTVIQRAMHIHPTVSELVPSMLGSLEPLAPQ